MVGTAVGQKTIDQQNNNVGQANRADHILKQAGFTESGPLTEFVVIQNHKLTVHDPAFQAAVRDVVSAVSPYKGQFHNLRSPLTRANRDQVTHDGHTALVEFDMNGTLKSAENRIDPLTNAVASVAKANPKFYVGEAGAVSSDKALNKMFNEQIGQAGTRSVPLTLLILVLVFGSLLAAFVPLMLALQSVVATIGLVAIVSHLTPMDPSVGAVVTLVGLAVGVDYSLFYLRREREERAAGRGERAALQAAAATSGRSVLISGATVMIAMAGMLFSGDKTFESFSIATMIVVAVAMIGSLTVLPAILSKLGDRVEKGRIPLIGRLRRQSGESRVWSAILTPVLRRPAVAAVLAAALLGDARDPDAPAPHRAVGPAVAAAERSDGRDARPHPGRVPRPVEPRARRGQDRHERARVPERGGQPRGAGRLQRSRLRTDPRRLERGARHRGDHDPVPGERRRRKVDGRAARRSATSCCRRRSDTCRGRRSR